MNHATPDSPSSGASGGKPTTDLVFLLSENDAMSHTDNVKGSGQFFSSSDERKAMATTYALSRGAYAFYSITSNNKDAIQNCANVQCPATWWLRTPYTFEDPAKTVYVDYSGYIMDEGEWSYTEWVGVRPALWVKYSK